MAFKKDPDAVLDYTFDWGPYLTPVEDSISTVTWVPDPGLTIVTFSHTLLTATAFVSGGTVGETLNLTCRIETANSRIDDRTISLKITNR